MMKRWLQNKVYVLLLLNMEIRANVQKRKYSVIAVETLIAAPSYSPGLGYDFPSSTPSLMLWSWLVAFFFFYAMIELGQLQYISQNFLACKR